MEELKPSKLSSNEYITVPKHFTASDAETHDVTLNRESFIQLREPRGERLRASKGRVLIAPYHPDLPLESGIQLQLIDHAENNLALGQSPLLSPLVSPSRIIDLARMGIVVEEQLVTKTDQVWANFNFHSRPPIHDDAPHEAQYNPLTLDIHGRDIRDEKNWTRPPATHGGWGVTGLTYENEAKNDLLWLEMNQPDIETLRSIEEEQRRFFGDIPLHPASPEAFQNWMQHPSGFYQAEGRRNYTYKEMTQLKHLYGYKNVRIDRQIEKIDALKLFSDDIQTNPDMHHSEIFPANDTDMVLFECAVGERAYQVVTQKVPLVDRDQGIHMVVKIRPEPHTIWDDPTATLEALGIGIGLTRLFQASGVLKDHQSDGEIGDVYFDFNANWSMTKKRDLIANVKPHELMKKLPLIKEAIQRDTRAHLHVQLEKMNAHWEVPPAPGTFAFHKPQTNEAIAQIRSILGDETEGLATWLRTNFHQAT